MTKASTVIAILPTHTAAEEAVRKLASDGIDMKAISLIGRNYHSEEVPVGYFNAGDRAKFFGKYGAFWGGLVGLLFSSLFIFIPVFGHVIILGPIASMVVSTLEGGVVGGAAGAIGGALSAIGVPRNSVMRYESAIKADSFIVAVQGAPEIVEKARKTLEPSAEGDVSTFTTSDKEPAPDTSVSAPAS